MFNNDPLPKGPPIRFLLTPFGPRPIPNSMADMLHAKAVDPLGIYVVPDPANILPKRKHSYSLLVDTKQPIRLVIPSVLREKDEE
jgi:hypothetical protein